MEVKFVILFVILGILFYVSGVYGNTITCSDSDATPSHPNGENFDVKGICSDSANPKGHLPGDNCEDLTTLNEWECYQCTEPYCRQVQRPCKYGCVDGRCQTYEELTKGLDIPKSGKFCIDGDGPDYPDLPTLKDLGCNKGNNRNNFSKQSFCLDNSGVYFDKCDGGYIIDYYCSDEGTCMPNQIKCEKGCIHGKCIPVPKKKGFCLNPVTDACTESYEDVCCPDDNSIYGKPNAPRNKEDCEKNYFVDRGYLIAPEKDKCKLVCCCELYYDDENIKRAEAIEKYRINCYGEDYTILDSDTCTDEACLDVYKNLPEKINHINNKWLSHIKEGRTCRAGNCTKGLLCLGDLKNASLRVCCKPGYCVYNGKCVKNEEITDGNYICQNSKWIQVKKEHEKKRGCSFVPGMKEPPDLGLIFIFAGLLFYSVLKTNFRFPHKDKL